MLQNKNLILFKDLLYMALLHHNTNTHTKAKANAFDVFRECNAEANLTFRYEECTGRK